MVMSFHLCVFLGFHINKCTKDHLNSQSKKKLHGSIPIIWRSIHAASFCLSSGLFRCFYPHGLEVFECPAVAVFYPNLDGVSSHGPVGSQMGFPQMSRLLGMGKIPVGYGELRAGLTASYLFEGAPFPEVVPPLIKLAIKRIDLFHLLHGFPFTQAFDSVFQLALLTAVEEVDR